MVRVNLMDSVTGILFAVALLVLVAYLYITNESARVSRRIESRIALGGLVNANGSQGAVSGRCGLLHYTDEICHFCNLERVVWSRVNKYATENGCTVQTLLSSPQGISGGSDSHDVLYVTVDFARGFRSRSLPTTVLMKPNGYVRWSKVGELSSSDAELIGSLLEQ